ncbi:MAG: hypothetical protein ACREEJ_15275 [Ensifer adhaerens]
MNAPARLPRIQPQTQTVVTKIVTETLTDNPDPATIMDRLTREGSNGAKLVRIAVMTHDGNSGVLAGAAVQEFDGNGLDLSKRNADVKPGEGGPVVLFKLDGKEVAKLSFETKDAFHLATQMAGLWTNGILTA